MHKYIYIYFFHFGVYKNVLENQKIFKWVFSN